MAYTRLKLDHYDANMKILNRLAKLNDPFDYGNGISLAAAFAACEKEKQAYLVKNGLLDQADEAGSEAILAAKNVDELMANLKNSIGIHKTRDSDEYVFAGGTRQSDVIAQQKATREDKKKAKLEESKKDNPQ